MSRPRTPPSRRAYILVTLFALALVALPFWFWYDTWFGRRLPDSSIEGFLHNTDRPRRMQQALVQIGERLGRGDSSVRRWYPRLIELAAHPNAELRQTVAWIMGQDRAHEAFRAPLHKLLADSSPMVRRNAALALASFRDSAGRDELRAMLRPHQVDSPAAGVVKHRLKVGDYANPGTLVARVGDEEVRTVLPGEVRELLVADGSKVGAGKPLMELGTDDQHAWEALRALVLVGSREDLDEVRRFLRSPNEKLQQQAQATIRQIESR
jgi:biotin carboxyl carrier protein